MRPNDINFRYLNREGGWPDFLWDGLEVRADGALQLISLPLLEGRMPGPAAALPPPDGPAGIAIDWDGSIYYSDPGGNRIYEIEGCFGETAPVPCIGGAGGQ